MIDKAEHLFYSKKREQMFVQKVKRKLKRKEKSKSFFLS